MLIISKANPMDKDNCNTAMADTRNGKPVVARAKGEVAKSWEKVVHAEERSRMMREMIKKGIGTKDVEHYFGKHCEF